MQAKREYREWTEILNQINKHSKIIDFLAKKAKLADEGKRALVRFVFALGFVAVMLWALPQLNLGGY